MGLRVNVSKDTVAEFCQRRRIRRLAFFGSTLRDDFGPGSDVDVLIEFEQGESVGYIALAGLEIELSEILGRHAELHTVRGLNPHFREEVLKSAEVQYEQAG